MNRERTKPTLFIKKFTVNKTSLQYEFYKGNHIIRSIILHNKAKHELIIFFYTDDKIVMISPVGQQPYYVLNDKVVDAKEIKHTPEQMEALIKKANEYLIEVYKKIN